MKNILIILSLLIIVSSAFATSCPSASAWSHEPGQPWVLNAPGWKAVTQGYYATNSELTKMPDTIQAYVTIIDSSEDRMPSKDLYCVYYDETYDPFGFISKNWVQAEPSDKQKLKATPASSFVCPSNFICHYYESMDRVGIYHEENEGICHFNAGNPETCAWE